MVTLLPGTCLFGTSEVTVKRRVQTGTDAFNAPVYAESSEVVAGVLAQPGATADLDASRPEGATVAVTFHFPRGYGKSLKGCRVSCGGREYRVVGDPQPYAEGSCPGPFSLTVEAEAVDG